MYCSHGHFYKLLRTFRDRKNCLRNSPVSLAFLCTLKRIVCAPVATVKAQKNRLAKEAVFRGSVAETIS
ncbi:hypothetical protein AWB80_03241 [Caballeronia pedi]|uniref:Uncharacterized protein n=1 Tax=Caballeronia pedi TaxID=1777141 RepID=A0A158BAC5_9BURK|nr:hypothetical protein AWB80_03241 [Caballeronia pedi]